MHVKNIEDITAYVGVRVRATINESRTNAIADRLHRVWNRSKPSYTPTFLRCRFEYYRTTKQFA